MMRGLEKYIPTLLLAPAVLPLVYFDGFVFPYMSPKIFVLRALGIALFAALLYLFLKGTEFYLDRLKEKATWIPGLLLLVAYSTSLIGTDFYVSFWSSFERGDGLLTLSVLVLFFYATVLTATKTFFDRFIKVVAYIASLVALYTLLQWVQGETGLNIPIVAEPAGRYGSTMGNAAFLAAYFGITAFLTLIAARAARGRMQTLLYVSAALQVFSIFVSATRGTILALGVAVGLCALYLAIRGGGVWRTYARIGVVSLAILASLFIAFRVPLAQSSIEPIRRLASISVTDGTVASRLFVWEHMLKEGAKRPFTGVGAEHIDVLFDRFYDPTGIVEEWFDRAHNAYLDYFVQYGVFGLALFFAFLIACVAYTYGYMCEEPFAGGMIALLLVVYALQNIFVFDTALTLYLILMLFALLIVRASSDDTVQCNLPRALPGWSPALLSFLILLLVIPVSLQPLRANSALAQGYVYHVSDVRRSVASMEKGLALDTYADLGYGYQTYEMYVSEQDMRLEGEMRRIAYMFALSALAANYDRYPYDARTAMYYAHMLDLSPPEIPRNEALLREVVEHTIELSPLRSQAWYLLANISLRQGDRAPRGSLERAQHYEEGIVTLKEYAARVPHMADPRYVIATLYIDIGKGDQAAEWAAEGLAMYKPDEHTARRAARYYIAIEDWHMAARMMRDAVTTTKGIDYNALYDLAKLVWLTGERDEVDILIERIKTEAPGLFESDPNFVAEYSAAQ